ncbi:zinc finger CCCH domain-containing protein 13 [Toxorhynchites rutilus septentrionalis]|uniref:zinc finger CCCH domain-containing protein 13 n=1 Tax=Toxorhynchites rutilus septentrionalis TaxID=329112 RepID=UPI0024788128|nr:zinc finger CCCH domain-containing protein 13 [Toxorhynchites rutilus septentrionalis]XP_055642098.1 zinc finger CCCH domain-containing protein 13 [Toxorhynchites rutilus septentrionalis]XP_055642100.1 zinc finger CCCH domain-containing protein 13 [Toxorhynchites rutilus septentrionalis]XP_055642101.1 zinc finger CCCH domain-containing protein 13 [Toxorhynchites rutilus septentrionalis]
MALRLRKDVQKASYYVWFLGAQEAKGLRGSRVLMPVIPRLIEKSKEHESLKVTLQISHKGLKIIQGSAKHFIPHGAITCSVQTEDIVACILLLYNPATKCPLHVHAYRCDSETTAQALNDQLQILINRPENQKRFGELETRLGLASQFTVPTAVAAPERTHRQMPRRYDSGRRFESSRGSDTGTSTRESECSEEQQHSPTSPISPISNQSKLYDSLAAELREKLSGGVPLLLPTKDLDKTNIGDSKRCRNPYIVGSHTSGGNKHGVSSRGSSGIGSDLAPSPERQDAHSSSDEEWVNDQETAFAISSHQHTNRHNEQYAEEPLNGTSRYCEPHSSYIYPNPRLEHHSNFQRTYNQEEDHSLRGSMNSREEEKVKPIIMKPPPLQSRFQDAFRNDDYIVEDRKNKITIDEKRYDREDICRRSNHFDRYNENDREEPFSYTKPTMAGRHHDGHEHEKGYYRENLTDRQKYREIISESSKYCEEPIRKVGYKDDYREYSPERTRMNKYSPPYDDHRDFKIERDFRDRSKSSSNKERRYISDESPEERFKGGYSERKPYKDNEPIPNRESKENNNKTPLTRYKSDETENNRKYDDQWKREHAYHEDRASIANYPNMAPRYREDMRKSPVMKKADGRSKTVEIKTNSPESTIRRISPKDRFQTAKEKFQQMERERHEQDRAERERQEREQVIHAKRVMEAPRRSSIEPIVVSSHESADCSSDEDIPPRGAPRSSNNGGYREQIPNERYTGLERESRMVPAKSLSNLNRGYRHSYAEPRAPPVSRSSGRVGLAAVNPY